MRRRTLPTLVIASLLAVHTAGFAQSSEEFSADEPPIQETPSAIRPPDVQEVAQMIVRRSNRFRKRHNRRSVAVNQHLTTTAEYFAKYMARTEKYGHRADGQRPSERAKQHGYTYCVVTENIAYRYSSAGFGEEELARRFVRGWKNSPGHRENLLDPQVTETGVGVAHSEETDNFYAVQMFGRPRTARIRFRVINRSDQPTEYSLSPTHSNKRRSFDVAPRMVRTHQRCRPTTLTFAFDESRLIAVEDDTVYAVTRDSHGQLTIRREALAPNDE